MVYVYCGTILNPINDKKCEFFKDGALVVQGEKILDYGHKNKILKKYLAKLNATVIEFVDGIIIPSFFDMHFHWVQDDVRTMPKDNLLRWLKNYTWPYEHKFKNKKYSQKKAKDFFYRLLKTGTMGGACYSSIHEHATNHAFKYAIGDFVIGNVLMTMNSPKYLLQKKSDAINITKKLSSRYKQKYALTPRFAITTDFEVMKTTSKIAKKNNSFIQTHLSETKEEIAYALSLFKGYKSYTEIYQKAGILGNKSIMGHAIHLTDDEYKILSKSKTAIAHCPTSNAPIKNLGLGSGLFDFKKCEKFKIRWALGSDIGGGPYLSMLDVMRSFVEQNRKFSGATYCKALYRATLAGAEILNLSNVAGNFKKNKFANFIVLQNSNVAGSSSENTLKNIMIQIKNRSEFDTLPKYVSFKGNLLN